MIGPCDGSLYYFCESIAIDDSALAGEGQDRIPFPPVDGIEEAGAA